VEELILKVTVKIFFDFSVSSNTKFGKQALLCFSKMKERLYLTFAYCFIGPIESLRLLLDKILHRK